MVEVINGKAIAASVRDALATSVARAQRLLGRPPGLGVILVGDDPASAVYVRNKERAAKKTGLVSRIVRLPLDATQDQVVFAVDAFNHDPEIDAFLVQLPLPKHLDADAIMARIAAPKDADGLLPANLGLLAAGLPGPRACTPSGIMVLLRRTGIEIEGAHAVIIGRSTIVGKPLALLLLEQHATVTLCHSRTKNLPDEVRRGDIVVAAVGRPGLIRGDWLKPGAAVIDVGINRVDGQLVGDVAWAEAKERAGAITPVPGGVGPMTIAMLLSNTVDAALKSVA